MKNLDLGKTTQRMNAFTKALNSRMTIFNEWRRKADKDLNFMVGIVKEEVLNEIQELIDGLETFVEEMRKKEKLSDKEWATKEEASRLFYLCLDIREAARTFTIHMGNIKSALPDFYWPKSY